MFGMKTINIDEFGERAKYYCEREVGSSGVVSVVRHVGGRVGCLYIYRLCGDGLADGGDRIVVMSVRYADMCEARAKVDGYALAREYLRLMKLKVEVPADAD